MSTKLLWTGVTLFAIAVTLATSLAMWILPLEIAGAILLFIGTIALWLNQ